MNLLTDQFISTTEGKIDLKQLLTQDHNYQLQYGFDEVQLAMLQLLSSLTTFVLKPTLNELKEYLSTGLSPSQYEAALQKLDLTPFDDDHFMQSVSTDDRSLATAPVAKLVSGIECGTSVTASGLFSDTSRVERICPDCAPILNYNLHMNIKGECFGPTGATGIRGGGSLTTIISKATLRQTVLANTIAVDYFDEIRGVKDSNNELMWTDPPSGTLYYGHQIGLMRGLFALAYHINFEKHGEPCTCDICGQTSDISITDFTRLKYLGHYGSTKNGRDGGAQWWPHPYTPTIKTTEGTFQVSPKGDGWQSWQGLASYIVSRQIDEKKAVPAPVIQQYTAMRKGHAYLLVGGNIADQGSVVGRIYELYAMPQHWDDRMDRVTKLIDAGIDVKHILVQALNKLYGIGYDKKFVNGIKQQVVDQYMANAQFIIQDLLVDVDRKELSNMRQQAFTRLQTQALKIYRQLMRKYQNQLPTFKALAKGERILARISKVTM